MKLTNQFDVAFYVKGDAKATQLYNVQLILSYELDAITVTTTADSGAGSLREAITIANATPGIQAIDFAIPGVGPQTIIPQTALPAITEAVYIDGTTQAGYTLTTPMIEIAGGDVGVPGADGLKIFGGGSNIRGLVINSFSGDAIELNGTGNNILSDNFLGTDVAGLLDLGNEFFGVHIVDSANNLIDGNLISGNDHSGVALRGAGSSGNRLVDNHIGTDQTGDLAIGNTYHGVIGVDGANANVIGVPGRGNLISGNSSTGVLFYGPTVTGNVLYDNKIGTNHMGASSVANGLYGVHLSDSSGNILSGNVISGNGSMGVIVRGPDATHNVIVKNQIGTDMDGLVAVPNAVYGVYVSAGANQNRIGGLAEFGANTISGNGQNGVVFANDTTTSNVVFGNLIGLDSTGLNDLGNSMHGVVFVSGAHGNRVGAPDDGLGNTISGNDRIGIVSLAGAYENVIVGNNIGTDAEGEVGVGNSVFGVQIVSSYGNFVDQNLIAANGVNGVDIRGNTSELNYLSRNQIGSLSSHDAPELANGAHGVLISEGAHNNNIGGSGSDMGNNIGFNGSAGVAVADDGVNNKIRFNSIFSNTNLGIDLNIDGWTINDAGDADIGPNWLQNYPTITSATLSGTTLQLTYFVDSAPLNADYPIVVDFYIADGSGREGQTFLFSDTFTPADFAAGSKLFTAFDVDLTAGQTIVAAATEGAGFASTSEFSLGKTIV